MKHVSDILALAGAGAVVYGAWALQPEAGFIVVGAFMLAVGIAVGIAEAAARRGGK